MKKKTYFIFHATICSLFLAIPTYTQATLLDPQYIATFLVDTAASFISDYTVAQSIANNLCITLKEKQALEKENCIDVNPNIDEFITLELAKVTHKKLGIKINPAYSPEMPIGTLYAHILLAQYVADEIGDALKNNNQTILNKWRAIIQHEAAHINNNDLRWRLVADCTTFIFGKLFYIYHINKFLPTRNFSWNETQFFKLHAAFCVFLITTCIRMAIYRYQEKRADMNIENDVQLLKGMGCWLKDFEQLTFTNYVSLNPAYDRYPIFYKINRWLINFFEEHPLNSARIKKLDQRIALLEKES